MNSRIEISGQGMRWGVFLLLILLMGGCATQKIDWTGRVGNYTYDQAVTEFGPPDKSAKLSDGTVVAEWLTRRGSHTYSAVGYGYYPAHYYGPIYPSYVDNYSPDYYLRLTFGPDGRLQAAKKFSK